MTEEHEENGLEPSKDVELPLSDEDIDDLPIKSGGVSIGELKLRAKGESGTAEEQEAARAEIREFNQEFKSTMDGLLKSSGLADRISRQAAAAFKSVAPRTTVTPRLPFELPRFETAGLVDASKTPAARAAHSLEELLKIQRAQADFNDAMAAKADKNHGSMVKLQWITIIIAVISVIATVLTAGSDDPATKPAQPSTNSTSSQRPHGTTSTAPSSTSRKTPGASGTLVTQTGQAPASTSRG